MEKRTPKKEIKGFTLLEVLVVVAIFGILASIILASTLNAKAKSRDTRRKQDLNEIRKALELFETSNNFYPGSSGPLNCLSGCDSTQAQPWIPGLTDVYIPIVPMDPSNNANTRYRYMVSANGNYEIDATMETDFARAENDGGNRNTCPGVTCRYEIGSDLTLLGDGP